MHFILFLVLSAVSHAQFAGKSLDKPLFYEIEKDGHVAYMLGTMHVDIPLNEFPAFVLDRLETSETVVTETNLDTGLPLVAEFVSAPNPSSLEEALTPEEWTKLSSTLIPAGITEEALEQMYPGNALNLYLQVLVSKFARRQEPAFMDAYLVRYAKDNGKGVDYLEDVQAQISVLKVMLADPAALKHILTFETVDDLVGFFKEQEQKMVVMVDTYFGGDEDLLYELSSAESTPEQLEILLNARNRNWIPEINRIVTQPGEEFIAFGAAHLGGEEGVINLLRKDGFTVTRVTEVPVLPSLHPGR